MKLEKGHLYHVFNRGNNGERIFYKPSNYPYFIEKLEYHVLPYTDMLGWCLMPNHFHLMIFVRTEEIFNITLNKSMGKMLSSYARAINIQENRTGSLFQQHTKALCLNENTRLKPSWYRSMGVIKINSWNDDRNYAKTCLDYIHMNPVNAGLVLDQKDWKWSSYHEIYRNNTGKEIVNKERLKIVVPL